MKTPAFPIACCVALFSLATGFAGEKPESEFPSPDGELAFRITPTRDHYALDLVAKANGKLVCKVIDSDEYGPTLQGDVLGAPDSKRFAFSSSEVRLASSVSVFTSEGDTFHEVKLPDCIVPEIPAKFENDERLHHWSEIGYWHPVRWQENGSLEIVGRTTRDGNENWVASARTVILAPDKAGKWRIVRSKDKVTSHFE